MKQLTIFWQDKLSDSFYWTLNQSAQKSSQEFQSPSAVHELENHHLLKADLACLADTAQGKKVELVLSSRDIFFSQLSLPNKAQRHLRKAVPFLIEEYLSENLDEVFIAIGDRLKTGETPVRVINQDYLQQLLIIFEEAEIKLASVRVDLDLLALPDSGFRLLMGSDYLVTEDNGERWSCDPADFNWLVQKKLAEKNNQTANALTSDDVDVAIAMSLEIVCDDETRFDTFQKALPVGVFAPQLKLVDSIEEYLSESEQKPFNLLQAEYAPKVENSPLKNLALKFSRLAAVILVAHIAYQASQIVELSNQQDLLTEQRESLRNKAFPGKKRITDKTLSSFMKTIGSGEGESSFLSMLDSATEKMTDLALIYPTNISYESTKNELRLDIIAKDLPVLNQYRDDLKQSGHTVEMSSATQRGDSYSSRLIISK